MKKHIQNIAARLETVANYRGKKALIIGAFAILAGIAPAIPALLS